MPTDGEAMDVDGNVANKLPPPDEKSDKSKKVSFAENVKPPAGNGTSGSAEADKGKADSSETKIDGIIGQLEVHRSGMIKMRLNNGMLLDVSNTLPLMWVPF